MFSNNKLTGSIPSEIGRLDKLCKLQGSPRGGTCFERPTLTYDRRLCSNRIIVHFNVNNNELTGSLPSELGLLGKEFGKLDKTIANIALFDSDSTANLVLLFQVTLMYRKRLCLDQFHLNFGN